VTSGSDVTRPSRTLPLPPPLAERALRRRAALDELQRRMEADMRAEMATIVQAAELDKLEHQLTHPGRAARLLRPGLALPRRVST